MIKSGTSLTGAFHTILLEGATIGNFWFDRGSVLYKKQ